MQFAQASLNTQKNSPNKHDTHTKKGRILTKRKKKKMFHAPLGQTQKTGVFFRWNTLEGEGKKKLFFEGKYTTFVMMTLCVIGKG